MIMQHSKSCNGVSMSPSLWMAQTIFFCSLNTIGDIVALSILMNVNVALFLKTSYWNQYETLKLISQSKTRKVFFLNKKNI
jgi:hypothetical protein